MIGSGRALMTDLLKALASRLTGWDTLRANPHYIYPARGDMRDDFSRVAQSMRAIDEDFRRVAARELNNEQTYQRQRTL